MQTQRFIFLGGLFLLLFMASPVFAVQGLDAHGQSKINKAMAQKWSQSDSAKGGYNVQQDKTIVNIGNKKSGGCNLNVGSVQPGQKAPKEIVVTTKEVINVCK
ncbi:MAG TPA: hypothetical protein DEQ20_02155 [Desulfobulbaceae bacterium]|nr:MAG: hypothetical protein A2520_03750 [Deltaproteobacteria bacterium RIFOXYD12_FULL_53_23]HCC53722.1 hypothetical protein [Desulfobulbaceae bacterium]